MIHTKEYLEQKYATPDPWGYQERDDDYVRKAKVFLAAHNGSPHDRALDIGCGEGFITKDLPANEIHGIEISDAAASRFPENVTRVHEPQGTYDLVVATGVLYDHYNYDQIVNWIQTAASHIIVTCNIEQHEKPISIGTQIYEERFEYYAGSQILRVFSCL